METMLFCAFLVMYFAKAFSANYGYRESPYGRAGSTTQDEDDSPYGGRAMYAVDDECGQTLKEPKLSDPMIQDRIIGGSEALPHSWPWQVSIRIYDSKKKPRHICGGTIIAQNKILSAAHCLMQYGMTVEKYSVAVGKHERLTTEAEAKFYKVKKISIQSSSNLNKNKYPDDIMVMTLTNDIIYDKNIRPVCLPDTPEPRDTTCYVTGWGYTESTKKKISDALQQIDVSIRDNTICRQHFNSTYFNPTNKICAGGRDNKDACQGDSGGPLVCQENGIWYQYGIVSSGKPCGTKNVPGLYTRVYNYRDWLVEKISE